MIDELYPVIKQDCTSCDCNICNEIRKKLCLKEYAWQRPFLEEQLFMIKRDCVNLLNGKYRNLKEKVMKEQNTNEEISTVGENNIKGTKKYWVANTQLGCFFAYLITEDKKVDFSSLDFANIKKENIFTVTIMSTDNQKKKIDYKLLDDKIEWEDEADEFFIVIVGKV